MRAHTTRRLDRTADLIDPFGEGNPLSNIELDGHMICGDLPDGGEVCGGIQSVEKMEAQAEAAARQAADEPVDINDPANADEPWYKIWSPRHDTAVLAAALKIQSQNPQDVVMTDMGIPGGSKAGNFGYADIVSWGQDTVQVWEGKNQGGAAEAAGPDQRKQYIKALQAKLTAEGDNRKVVAGGAIGVLPPVPNAGNPNKWITVKDGKSKGMIVYSFSNDEPKPRQPQPDPVPEVQPQPEYKPEWAKSRPLWGPLGKAALGAGLAGAAVYGGMAAGDAIVSLLEALGLGAALA